MDETDFPPLETAQTGGNCHPVEMAPAGRPDLAFRLTLPIGWRNDPAAVGDPGDGSAWTSLAVFAEKPSAEPSGALLPEWALVSVLWRKLEFEVPLDEWTAVELGGMQVDIDSVRMWNDVHGPVIDAAGTTTGVINRPTGAGEEPVSVPVSVRAVVRSAGSNAFAVWCMATRGAYPAARNDFALAGRSFELLQPTHGGIERIEIASTANPAFEVAHPASWMHQAVATPVGVAGKSALDLILINEQLLHGLVRVKAVDLRVVEPASMEDLMSDALEELAQAGIAPQAPWSPNSDPVILSTPDLRAAYLTQGILQDASYELHFGVVVRPPLLFLVSALVLPIQTDAGLCLRGHRAYGIALASLRPLGLA